jgi:hypothetical protein
MILLLKSIFNVMITSASDMAREIFLLKHMDSKMIRKIIQSSKELISTSLSLIDWRSLFISLRAKSV